MNPEGNKIYIIGNWKMNPLSLDDAETVFDEMENDMEKIKEGNVEAAICMPYIFLSDFDSDGRIKLGAQDLFWEKQGTYTGEISGEMLRKIGVRYVIVGHSERRRYLGETDEMVNLKVRAALASGLCPILCVGETREARENGDTGEVVAGQLEKALQGVAETEAAGKLIIAYEPVWAISSGVVGSGVTPSTDEVMSVGLLIRKILGKIYASREAAEITPILYGGSVSSQNSFDLVDKTGMNGLLVGGASLQAREFMPIIKRFIAPK